MNVNFAGPRLKLNRAIYHINTLEKKFANYFKINRRRIGSNKSSKKTDVPRTILSGPLPKFTPTILGDAVHNLRVSLDHTYTILVEHNGGTPNDWTHFPFGGDIKSVAGMINGKKGAIPHQNIIDFILNEVEPFPGGRLALYELHKLDIMDKHSTVLPTNKVLNFKDVEVKSADGQVMMTIGDVSNFKMAGGGGFINAAEGSIITHKGTQNAIDIRFGPGQFKDKSILETLYRLRENVEKVIDELENISNNIEAAS